MRVVVLYRPTSKHGRSIEEFIRDFKRRHEGARLEVENIDSRDGSAMASLYDIMRYPAILALRNDGSVLQVWQGPDLPLMSDVAYYTMNQD